MRLGGEGIGERAHHRLLADQIVEARGPVFARQHAIGAAAAAGARQPEGERGFGGGAGVRRVLVSHPPSSDAQDLAPLRRERAKGESRRLDKDPPWLVRAASFRT